MAKRSTNKTPSPASSGASADRTRLACLVLIAATIAAYFNTMRSPFVFDDKADIVDNRTIRHLWPPWRPLLASSADKTALHGRPVVNFSLAVNYAMGGLNPLPYHLTNLAIHVLAGLTLFGIVRRTLVSSALGGRYAAVAMPLALAISAIWTLHPLQTQSVTYTVQRYESLMGLFYLLSLYCAIRSHSSPGSHGWEAASVAACLLAMECKEVAVSIPLMILLYDRTFLAGSFGEAWRRRRGMYLGLAATWLVFLILFSLSYSRAKWAGYGLSVSAVEYARSQFGVILHYLRLSFWPYPQVLDYDWPVARTAGQIVPGMVVIGVLLAASVWALARRPAWGMLGAWFFVILAPTSSIMPIADLAFEHRMYLPLAAVVVAATIAAYEAIQWCCVRLSVRPGAKKWMQAGLALAVAAALCLASRARNEVYRSDYAVWSDVVAKVPHNARAHNNLGAALGELGRMEQSLAECQKALELSPFYATAHYNLAQTYMSMGKKEEAVSHYQKALEIMADRDAPESATAHSNLAYLLYGLGNHSEAVVHYRKALEIDPEIATTHYNLANALSAEGKFDEAISLYERAIQLDPDYAVVHNNLANVLYRRGRLGQAVTHYEKALALNPGQMETHCSLAAVLTEQGRLDEAISHCRKAIAIDADFAEAFHNLGRAFSLKGDYAQAATAWREALRLRPKRAPFAKQLAWMLATCPDKSVRNGAEAVELARRAIELAGESRELLDVLAAAQAESGRFADALETAQKALKLGSDHGNAALAEALRGRIKLYQAGMAFHDPGPSRGTPAERDKPVGWDNRSAGPP